MQLCGVDSGADVTLRGLFLGNKADADALLLSSGFLDVPGISYTFYLEQPYVQSMLFFAWQTQGEKPSLRIWPAI